MSTAPKIEQPRRMLTAAACRFCGQDRPLTNGSCNICTTPIREPRWRVDYTDAMGEKIVAFLVTESARDQIVRYFPMAVVTDLLSLACPASECGGTCTGRCDSGNGAAWEVAEADRTGRTVSELRAEVGR